MYYRGVNKDGDERMPALALGAQAKDNVYHINKKELRLLEYPQGTM